ncbi:MAG: GPW/gp25 family protein [Merismopedia sp. SIO2A8]|nr:GPW/gp25 family protein [Symploca sp. SIO2B6]NET48821.1 GPW/gp25 family protein [Merismopedia sp. SIO2A8]
MVNSPTNPGADDTYLGQGIAFPMRLSVQGNLQLTAAGQNIDEAIRLILKTRIGERVYRPDFGCRLSDLVFAPMNSQTLLMIRLCVEEALKKWEPRIILDAVETEPDPHRGLVTIVIRYHPKNSHDRRSLVYPFYLIPSNP